MYEQSLLFGGISTFSGYLTPNHFFKKDSRGTI